jgi:hypothetical protein
MSNAADLVMRCRSPKGLHTDILTGGCFNYQRSGNEHLAGISHHQDEVGQGRGINRAAGAGAHDHRNLRDHSGSNGIPEKDLAVSIKGVHAFLNAGSARVTNADYRGSDLHGHIENFTDFCSMNPSQGAADNGKVLGKDINPATCDSAVATRHTFAVYLIEVICCCSKDVNFSKGARIIKLVDPFPACLFPACMLFVYSFLAAASFDLLP